MTIKIVVPISGGKDSQACMKLAISEYGRDHVVGLFCDTQFEHPETYKHVDRIAELYGVTIHHVSGGSVLEKCEKYGRFPGGGARHCTDELKMRETRIFLQRLILEYPQGFEVWYGMRTAESGERARRYQDRISTDTYQPHEVFPSKYPQYLGKAGVRFRMPILDWTSFEVLDFLAGEQHPFYAAGFDRVGCFPCLASGDEWKEKAFSFDEFGASQRVDVMALAEKIGKDVWTSKGGAQRNNPAQGCLLCSI